MSLLEAIKNAAAVDPKDPQKLLIHSDELKTLLEDHQQPANADEEYIQRLEGLIETLLGRLRRATAALRRR